MTLGIAALTRRNGGGTFDAEDGLRPFTSSGGYVVGSVRGTAAFALTTSRIRVVASQVAREYGSRLVGTWVNPETGIVHIDPVTYVWDRERAMSLARWNRQEAIYGFAEGDVIYVEKEA